MTRDDIIRMALEIGYPLACYETGPYVPPLLETLLNRAAAFEREVCERLAWDTSDNEETGIRTAIALAIRARGEK